MRALPPLELHAEIDTADGLAQYRWDADAADPEDRPQSISCGSSVMNGFANGGATLSRKISREYPDLNLYDTLRFVGHDGQIAYEGRGSRFPRESGPQDKITAEAVGWMAHARDRAITFLGVDQDMASWGSTTSARQAALQIGGYAPKGPGVVLNDKALSQSFDGTWVAGELPICEAWFDAGPGQDIGRVDYAMTRGINVPSSGDGWQMAIYLAVDLDATGAVGTGNLQGVTPGAIGTHLATTDGNRYALVEFYNDTPGGTVDIQWNVDWTRLAVRGSHGLPLAGSGPPFGLLASDIITHTAALAAPLLDTSGVLPSSHPIEQFAFRDLTDPYDIWLLANQYERRNLAVWEGRRLTYEPFPDPRLVQTPDWILRSDHDNNLRRSYDGPTTEGQKNGASVRFQNILTGAADLIDPTTHPELAVTDPRLAANRAGVHDWQPIQLPNPNTPAGAARVGRAALDEFNRQRTPGRFTITGHIQDAAENWHQGWIVRAGQTVLLEEDEDDPVRVIYEAGWSQDGHTLTISADAASKTIDAIIADMGV